MKVKRYKAPDLNELAVVCLDRDVTALESALADAERRADKAEREREELYRSKMSWFEKCRDADEDRDEWRRKCVDLERQKSEANSKLRCLRINSKIILNKAEQQADDWRRKAVEMAECVQKVDKFHCTVEMANDPEWQQYSKLAAEILEANK
jgi:hypothetical protein